MATFFLLFTITLCTMALTCLVVLCGRHRAERKRRGPKAGQCADKERNCSHCVCGMAATPSGSGRDLGHGEPPG